MLTESDLQVVLQKYLTASYAYYILDETIMPDAIYDAMAKTLLEEWSNFTHIHKHLIDTKDLTSGTLYHLQDGDYPAIVKVCALNKVREQRKARL